MGQAKQFKEETRNQQRGTTNRGRVSDSEFVNLELSAQDKKALQEFGATLDDLDAAMEAVLSDGTKITLKWDERNSAYAAFAFAPDDSENAGYILTGRGRGISRALRQLAYKHTVLLAGDWASYHNRAADDDSDDW